MKNDIKIIPCKWKHYALLAELGASTFYETFSAFHSESDMQAYIEKTYNLNQVKENLSKADIYYFVAYGEQGDLGYIKLLENIQADKLEGKIMELEKIYVRKEFHGTSVATLLMQKAIDLSIEKKCDHLFLGVWQENARALAFYHKCGFNIFNTRNFQLGDTLCEDYLLELPLNHL